MKLRTIKELDAPGRFTMAEAREAARALLLETAKRPDKKPAKETSPAKNGRASSPVAAKRVRKPASKEV
jgi:hypothetical protein